MKTGLSDLSRSTIDNPISAEELDRMTLQVGICCANGSIVLASDTQIRTSERTLSTSPQTTTVANRSKIAHAENHEVAVAFAGSGSVGTDAARELADQLSALDSVPDNLAPVLIEWGNGHFRKYCLPGEVTNRNFPMCSMLVVNPKSEYCRLWKLRVNYASLADPEMFCLVNGADSIPAVFWLEYTKANKGPAKKLDRMRSDHHDSIRW